VRVTGVIQAGGQSTRMGGHPKALLEVGGRPVIRRVIDALAPVLDDLLIVTNTPELYAPLGLPLTGDVLPGAGALGGILSGLRAIGGEAALTVACDMPFLDREVVRLLVERAPEGDVVIPRVRGHLETLHAVYGKTCLPHIEAQVLAGRLKIAGFFDQVRVVEIGEAEIARRADPWRVFINVNTPDDLARARALAAGEGA